MDNCFTLLLVGTAALLMAGTVLRAPVPVRAAVVVAMLVSVLAASAGDAVVRLPDMVIALAS
jgi:hypothetical protein